MKKFNFSASLGALTTYIEENKADLIMKALYAPKTRSLVDVRTGIKNEEKIPILDSTAPFQAASTCGFNSSGTTTVTQTSLLVKPIKMQESICLQDFETYFTQKWLPSGSQPETISIATDIVNRKIAHMAKALEQMFWQANTAHTFDPNLKLIDGWIKKIDAASDEVIATAQADITASTVLGIFEDIYNKIPADVIGSGKDTTAFCGWDTFRILLNKLSSTNYFHYTTDAAARSGEIFYPGTNLKVVAVSGLNADNNSALPASYKDRIVATYNDNLVIGYDLQNEEEDIQMWYSQDDQLLKFSVRLKVGVAVHFTDHVVTYANT